MAEFKVQMTSAKGETLYTKGTFCEEDIVVTPELEEITITENGEYTPSKVGYSKVNVDVETGGGYRDIPTYHFVEAGRVIEKIRNFKLTHPNSLVFGAVSDIHVYNGNTTYEEKSKTSIKHAAFALEMVGAMAEITVSKSEEGEVYIKDYGVEPLVTQLLYGPQEITTYKLADYIIKIDHHDDSPDYANINYVDPTSPACASILVRLFRQWKFKLNKEIATYLYLAITTDTGRFRYRGVNEEVLANAGYLLSYEIDTDKLYTNLYIKEDKTFKLQGYVYQNFKRTEHGVAYMHMTKELMEEYGVTKDDAANLVNCMDSVRGSLIWVVFVDQMYEHIEAATLEEDPGNEIRVRIRSRFVAINEVATHFRGGGHLMAAGATIYSLDEKEQILSELDTLLKEYKENNPEVF